MLSKKTTNVYFLFFTIVTQLFAQVQFEPHSIVSPYGPVSIYSADMDGDGDIDILSASQGDYESTEEGKITWYENDGESHFTLHVISIDAGAPSSIVAADVDSDGDMDVISASHEDFDGNEPGSKITWYENDGQTNFSTHIITTIVDGATSVHAADIDGDGDIDVLSASFRDDKIAWYENDGQAGFITHDITTQSDEANSVYAIDIDGDGDMDVLSASVGDNTIAWYENDGQASFSTHIISTMADGATSVHAADIDGDGDIDVLSASFRDDKIAWYENDGQEGFMTHVITTQADGVNSVYAIDIDGDGDMDVLSSTGSHGRITWFENNGMEEFRIHLIMNLDNYATSIYAADIDSDGDMDVFAGGLGVNRISWFENIPSTNYAPDPFSLLFPESGAILHYPYDAFYLFQWEPAQDLDPVTYKLIFSSDSWDTTFTLFNLTTRMVEIEEFPTGDSIIWSVMAMDEWGLQTESSDTNVFFIDKNNNQAIVSLKLSNKWYYLNEYGGYSTIEVVGDTLINNYGFKTLKTTDFDSNYELGGSSFDYWGIVENNLIRRGNDGGEQVLFNPSITQDTVIGDTTWDDDGLNFYIISPFLQDYFGGYYDTQLWDWLVDGGDGGRDYEVGWTFARGLGLTHDMGQFHYYRLIGSFIDGQVLGDTSLSSFVNTDTRNYMSKNHSLLTNYPNPFNPSTTIEYVVRERCHVRLEIFNVDGQSVAILVDKEMSTGYHKLHFNGNDLNSGVYLYRIQMGDYISTKKMVIVK